MADWRRVAALDDVWGVTVVAARAGEIALVLVRSGEGSAADRVWLLTGPTGTTIVVEQDRHAAQPSWMPKV